MIAVIFEVWPKASMKSTYISIAESLAPLLQHVDGFLSIERFESLTVEGKILSLSFWRDEHAVEQWRRLESHRAAQARGRAEVFADYRLRIAGVVRDYGMRDRDQAPTDSRTYHGYFVELRRHARPCNVCNSVDHVRTRDRKLCRAFA
jgi:heme-degrading monooxygenase HmoA